MAEAIPAAQSDTQKLILTNGEEDVFISTPQIQSKHKPWHWLLLLLLWQVLTVTLTGSAVFSQLLAESDVNAPNFQIMCNYIVLAVVYSLVLIIKRQKPKLAVWKYLLLAFIDVEANFCGIRAFQYTNLTSIQLLDCFAVPSIMLISWWFFKVRYNYRHCFGVFVSLVGVGLLIVSDIIAQAEDDSPTNALVGDLYAICGALLYAITDVCEEYVVKTHDNIEYLAFLGIFGTTISGLQVAALEQQNLLDITWTGSNGTRIIIYFVCYCICMFILQSGIPILLMKGSSATVMNLSYLTGGFWALLFGLFLFDLTLSGLYFGALVVIVIGLLIYNLADQIGVIRDYLQGKKLLNERVSGREALKEVI